MQISSSNLFIEVVFNCKKADVEYLNVGRGTLYRDEGMIGYLHMELYCAINKFYILHEESHRWDASQSEEATHK